MRASWLQKTVISPTHAWTLSLTSINPDQSLPNSSDWLFLLPSGGHPNVLRKGPRKAIMKERKRFLGMGLQKKARNCHDRRSRDIEREWSSAGS